VRDRQITGTLFHTSPCSTYLCLILVAFFSTHLLTCSRARADGPSPVPHRPAAPEGYQSR
jgi:hypothetical protein